MNHTRRRFLAALGAVAPATWIGENVRAAVPAATNISWPSSLKPNPYVRMIGGTVICNGPGRRHRAFPTGVRLPNGDILVGYRVARDHWMTAEDAYYITRSTDDGHTWQTPLALAAEPGWGMVCAIGQYPDGVLPTSEPYLRLAVRMNRWRPDMPADGPWAEHQFSWSMCKDYDVNAPRAWEPVQKLYGTIAEVQTDRGPMKFWGLEPHDTSTTMHRLSDGRLMGLWVGRTDLMCYNPHSPYPKPSDTALVGFCSDDLKTWTYRIVADKSQGGIGYSESDLVRLPSGRFLAIYGNNAGSPWFYETHSDDEGQTWSPMRQLNFRGDSPSMIRLSSGALLAAIRSLPEKGQGKMGVGLVASRNEGKTWELLGNVQDQTMWDMAYPDLVKLANGQILCLYYTENQKRPIPHAVAEKLAAVEPMHTIFKGGIRPAAFGEIQSEIRGVFLEELGGGASQSQRPYHGKPAGVSGPANQKPPL